MRSFMMSLAAFGALAACAAAATPAPVAAPQAAQLLPQQSPAAAPTHHTASVWCDIRITPTRNGLRFEPLAESPHPVSGDYRFVLTRTDASGSSDVEQSGSFDLAPRRIQVLGSSELSLDRGARYRARLVLGNDHEGVMCREEVRS